jgi:SAM-dependent methyltransferase
MKFPLDFFDVSNPQSLSNKFRRRRFRHFLNFAENFPKPIKILDAGGTQNFWEQMNFTSPDNAEITILNKDPVKITLPNFRFMEGDIRSLNMFSDDEFDVVFSNSAIEHLNTNEDRKIAAKEIMRAGKKYYVQTPNYYFPFEPHFLFPFFQFLPEILKIFLLVKFRLGWYKKAENKAEAEKLINSIKLLTKKELLNLFAGSKLYKEKFLFLTKSLVVYN